MSIKKIIAIGVIFLVGVSGWYILGTATALRSRDTAIHLSPMVQSLWGIPLVQNAPCFSVKIPGTDQVRWIMPAKNDIQVELIPDYRKKGLIWYSTYNCIFRASYTITNPEQVVQKIRLHFDFPAKGATYDDFAMFIDEKLILVPVDTSEGVRDIIELDPGQSVVFTIRYKTRGIGTWRYQMDRNVGRVQNLNLTAKTGFRNIDYTEEGLSPMSVEESDSGMVLKWEAADLITNGNIGIVIPEKLNPGPLTSRITFFAPVCLIFFFVLISTINIMYKINIHPMHYLFVAAGFFAFHLLLTYLSGHIWIHLSFLISAVISVTLVTSYLSAALGNDFPWKIAAAGQVFFLVLFSYSFFIKGITGITVAIGSVVTLGILMKVTADIDWDEVFKSRSELAAPVSQKTMKEPHYSKDSI